MRLTFFIILSLYLASCSGYKKKEAFFKECNVSDLDLLHGITVLDSLSLFSFKLPDSSWQPKRVLNDKVNQLIVGDTSRGFIRLFSVNQSVYSHKWNWDEEFKHVERDFHVIEHGELMFQGRKRPYHLILFDDSLPEIYTFYLLYLDTSNKRQFILNISVEKSTNYKSRICEMKPILDSFRIIN